MLLSDLPDHPAPLRPPTAKVSSRTVSHVSTSLQPPQTLPKPFTQQPAPTPAKPPADSQPPPTYPRASPQSPQTQARPQGFIQPLPKPYLQTPPKPQCFPQAPVLPQSLDPDEDFGRDGAHSADLLSPTESVDLSPDGMSAKQMSIKER